ncbi:MAG: hypothetical protein H0V89_01740 [Deltaproteobacteria bacterium]|nr:hypothetical protein [Deltaproteobacteria bacterium]
MLFHVTALAEGARTVFPTLPERLGAVRRLARHFGKRSLWFCLSDTHLHELIEAREEELPFILRDLKFVLDGLSDVQFDRPKVKPVREQSHLENCWKYVVSNREKHGLDSGLLDPGAGFVDVVGARVLPGFDRDRWKVHLPRWKTADLLGRLRLPLDATRPATPDEVRAHGSFRLARSAAAAVGFPDLSLNIPHAVAARSAAIQLGLEAGLARADLAHAVQVVRQTTYGLGAAPAEVLDALKRRITLETTTVLESPS